jgi:hypothetical protein
MKMSARLVRQIIKRNAEDAFAQWVKRRRVEVYFTANIGTPRVLSVTQDTPELAFIGSVRNLAEPPGHPAPSRLALSACAQAECQFEARKPPTEYD